MNAQNSWPANRGRLPGRRLFIAAACAIFAGLLYAEENWRGKCAWEDCQRDLAARNIALNWTNYVPAPVPGDQNIFGVPEMAQWFDGRLGTGWIDFTLPIYVCPADPYTMDINGTRYPLVRSVSMNERMNGGEYQSAPLAQFNNPNKLAAIVNPGPSTAFVFVDERGDSINDGFFVVDMVDTGAQAAAGNIPADYHNGCSSVSFADAHVEIHRWLDPRTEMRPYQPYLNLPNDPDIAWLQEHCCSRK